MFEPNRREVDHDIEVSKDLFERARVGPVHAIQPHKLSKVLVVLDGSEQDALSITFARHLRNRFECDLIALDAREGETETNLAEQIDDELLAVTVLPKPQGDSFQQILDAVAETGAELVIVPCPYGRDLNTLGADSTGTVIDVLLARSPVPILVVRRPYQPAAEPFRHVLFVLIGENEAAPAAASWAAALVPLAGEFELQLVLEHEFFENIRDLLHAIDPSLDVSQEILSRALEKTHIRLHRALQLAADEHGFRYHMHSYQEGDPAEAALDDESAHPLIVLALERHDHASEGHVHDRIRRTPNPLLVVPVH